jgi:hypothetical protein
VFTDLLPSNGRPIVVRFSSCGNVFMASLPSNGSIRREYGDGMKCEVNEDGEDQGPTDCKAV